PGFISGHIVFGSVTGMGIPDWPLVPQPRNPGEIRRAYVFTTMADPFSRTPSPGGGGVIDYANDGSTAWEFTIVSRPAAVAVYALAGLYDPNFDPDGEEGEEPPGVFQPFAMGVARGIIVGPAEEVKNVTVVVDMPLDTAVRVDLQNPPKLGVPAPDGPTEYYLRALVDLGGEGVIALPGSEANFLPGSFSAVLRGMAPIMTSIGDCSYTIITGALTYGDWPFSMRIVRGIKDLSAPVEIGNFLGLPRAIDPEPYGTVSASHLQFEPDRTPASEASSGPDGEATFIWHKLIMPPEQTMWTIIARGDQFDVPLPDVTEESGAWDFPTDDIWWVVYEATVPGLDFNNWSYRHLNPVYWSAYAISYFTVRIPYPNI
ncbi:MAG: hypothetical protein V2A73_18890, partial [Pseudomonadota bacterium]